MASVKREVFLDIVTFRIWLGIIRFQERYSKGSVPEHNWDVQEYRSRKVYNVSETGKLLSWPDACVE